MEKYIYNEKNGLWYELQDDYYLPCLKLPEDETAHIGVWERRHLRYLKQHHRVRCYNLLTSGKLNGYLADIDRQAEGMFSRQVKQLTEKEGVTKTLKAENQMLWVQKMNNLKNAAMEIVSTSLFIANTAQVRSPSTDGGFFHFGRNPKTTSYIFREQSCRLVHSSIPSPKQWLGYWIRIGHPLAFVEKDGFLFAVVQRLGLVATIPALIFGILRDVIDGACVKGSWYSRSGSVPVISYEDCTGRFHRVQISASLPQPTPE